MSPNDSDQRDTLFQQEQPLSPFSFNREVAQVFEDMIGRSVPGYALTLEMIAMMASQYATDNSRCYDLGCSLGTASFAMAQSIEKKDCAIIAVDNSESMLEKARQNQSKFSLQTPIKFLLQDITQLNIQNAAMVVMNFTLQFVNESLKGSLLKSIYNGLNTGGVFVLSEKIRFDNDNEQKEQVRLHHGFKRFKGYSDLEISQKRNALEKVLIPDTLDIHQQRLSSAGFRQSFVWFQCFNFVSLIAFK